MLRDDHRSPGPVLTVTVHPVTALPADVLSSWRALAQDCEEPNPFYEPEATVLAAQLLAGGDGARLLLVADGSELVLALPVRRRHRFRHLPVRALAGWRHAYCYLGTPLVRRGRAHEAWTALLDHWETTAEESWLVLEQQLLDGPVARALQQVLATRGRRASVLGEFARPVLHRRPDPTYLDGRISARHLKALRRQRRRLADRLGGPVEVVDRASDARGCARAVEGLLAVELAGWKGGAGTAMASRPGDAEFFRRLCSALREQGRLQLWTLGASERAAAYQANVVTADAVFHVKIAYDEALRAQSPGLQLELEMVEEFHRDTRLSRIDSCGEADNVVSTQLYPDRARVGTLLVPLRGLRGRAVVRVTPPAAAAYRSLQAAARAAVSDLRGRVGGRAGQAPPTSA